MIIIIDNLLLRLLYIKFFRIYIFKQACKNKLRNHKIGRLILRNLNSMMASKTDLHEEFSLVSNSGNYQSDFWASDLGYMWYQGNYKANNAYFAYAINEIKLNDIQSVLDVGCGWGEFCLKCSELESLKIVKGIDVSNAVVEKARSLKKDSVLDFQVKDFLEEKDSFDLITVFGSIDYIQPDKISDSLRKMVFQANKEIIIVNSLRKMAFNEYLMLENSVEVKRYDIGFVHPLNFILNNLKQEIPFEFRIDKAGIDSALIVIKK